MVVEEGAGRIKAAAQLDERLGPGIAGEELVSGQEMKLAPMNPSIEVAEKFIDIFQVRLIVSPGLSGNRNGDAIPLGTV